MIELVVVMDFLFGLINEMISPITSSLKDSSVVATVVEILEIVKG